MKTHTIIVGKKSVRFIVAPEVCENHKNETLVFPHPGMLYKHFCRICDVIELNQLVTDLGDDYLPPQPAPPPATLPDGSESSPEKPSVPRRIEPPTFAGSPDPAPIIDFGLPKDNVKP